ncbi:MAG: phenylacetate--CoA ligase family protein, partial [Akkermansiaceae bacterium]|nr:phenylacetate--CoA ligase family protein [Akkermansiaceae bacterium]
SGLVDEDAWRSLPLLEKAEVQREHADLKSRGLDPREKVAARQTSGSTGVPLEVYITWINRLLFAAIRMRFLHAHGYEFTGKVVDIHPMSAEDPLGAVRRHAMWEWPLGELFETGELIEMDICSEIPDQVDLLEREAPRYCVTHPSNLRLLLAAFRKSGRRLPSLRMVRTRGETISPEVRAECREVLGVPLIDAYGATEAGYIATQCPGHDHYHVQSETNLVEVLHDDGTPCGPGESGRIVVTPLQNLAMPLLRYDLGDFAEVGEACPCGRGLPVLRRIHGREKEVLTLPSGEKRYSFFPSTLFKDIPGVARFQIVQTKLTELELRIVAERPLTPGECGVIEARLENQAGPGFAIRWAFVDEIPPLPGGKRMEFVSEIKAGG